MSINSTLTGEEALYYPTELLNSDGRCLNKCVVYKTMVIDNQETYIGLTENEFKTSFNLHKSSFKLEHKRTATTRGGGGGEREPQTSLVIPDNHAGSERWN